MYIQQPVGEIFQCLIIMVWVSELSISAGELNGMMDGLATVFSAPVRVQEDWPRGLSSDPISTHAAHRVPSTGVMTMAMPWGLHGRQDSHQALANKVPQYIQQILLMMMMPLIPIIIIIIVTTVQEAVSPTPLSVPPTLVRLFRLRFPRWNPQRFRRPFGIQWDE